MVLTSRGGWGVTGQFLWRYSILPCQGGLQTHSRCSQQCEQETYHQKARLWRFVTPRFVPVNDKMSAPGQSPFHHFSAIYSHSDAE